MILTVLIGNTNARLAFFEGRRLVRVQVVPTARVEQKLTGMRLDARVEGAAVASVVPKMTLGVYRMLSRQVRTVLLGSRTAVPLQINYNRRLLGADRLCAAVGGFSRFQRDLVVIDVGTAVNFSVVKLPGVFYGGPILPGAALMLEGLAAGTGRLPRVDFYPRTRVIWRQTMPAVQSGVFHLLVGGIRQILRLISTEAALKSPLILGTGGGIRRLVPYLPEISMVDDNLASRGLAEIYYYNNLQEAE